MKTLADIKRRCVTGVKLKMTFHIFDAPKIVGIVRPISVVKSNEIGLQMPDGRPSFLTWPKAAWVRVTGPDSFDILMGDDAYRNYKPEDVFMSYEFVD